MNTTIQMSDDQITNIVVHSLKESYLMSMHFSETDESALEDAKAIKHVLSYYMHKTEFDEWFDNLDKHSKYYFAAKRNK
jgi:hypothetical protein